MKYKTIETHNVEELDAKINEKLREGWDLRGDLVIIVDHLGYTAYHQGMILMTEGDF